MLAAVILPVAAPVKGQISTSTPTVVPSKTGPRATPAVSVHTRAKNKKTTSSIFRVPAAKRGPNHIFALSPLGLSTNPEFSTSRLDYDKLNADLYPLLTDQTHRPSADEKFWGTVAGVATDAMAGAAAAQYLGILPDGQIKKKK